MDRLIRMQQQMYLLSADQRRRELVAAAIASSATTTSPADGSTSSRISVGVILDTLADPLLDPGHRQILLAALAQCGASGLAQQQQQQQQQHGSISSIMEGSSLLLSQNQHLAQQARLIEARSLLESALREGEAMQFAQHLGLMDAQQQQQDRLLHHHQTHQLGLFDADRLLHHHHHQSAAAMHRRDSEFGRQLMRMEAAMAVASSTAKAATAAADVGEADNNCSDSVDRDGTAVAKLEQHRQRGSESGHQQHPKPIDAAITAPLPANSTAEAAAAQMQRSDAQQLLGARQDVTGTRIVASHQRQQSDGTDDNSCDTQKGMSSPLQELYQQHEERTGPTSSHDSYVAGADERQEGHPPPYGTNLARGNRAISRGGRTGMDEEVSAFVKGCTTTPFGMDLKGRLAAMFPQHTLDRLYGFTTSTMEGPDGTTTAAAPGEAETTTTAVERSYLLSRPPRTGDNTDRRPDAHGTTGRDKRGEGTDVVPPALCDGPNPRTKGDNASVRTGGDDETPNKQNDVRGPPEHPERPAAKQAPRLHGKNGLLWHRGIEELSARLRPDIVRPGATPKTKNKFNLTTTSQASSRSNPEKSRTPSNQGLSSKPKHSQVSSNGESVQAGSFPSKKKSDAVDWRTAHFEPRPSFVWPNYGPPHPGHPHRLPPPYPVYHPHHLEFHPHFHHPTHPALFGHPHSHPPHGYAREDPYNCGRTSNGHYEPGTSFRPEQDPAPPSPPSPPSPPQPSPLPTERLERHDVKYSPTRRKNPLLFRRNTPMVPPSQPGALDTHLKELQRDFIVPPSHNGRPANNRVMQECQPASLDTPRSPNRSSCATPSHLDRDIAPAAAPRNGKPPPQTITILDDDHEVRQAGPSKPSTPSSQGGSIRSDHRPVLPATRHQVRYSHTMPTNSRMLPPNFWPTENTVIMGGTGDAFGRHAPGNKRLVELVLRHLPKYCMPKESHQSVAEHEAIIRQNKVRYISKVVREVNLRHPVAGFVRFSDSRWWETSEREAWCAVKKLFTVCSEQYCSGKQKEEGAQIRGDKRGTELFPISVESDERIFKKQRVAQTSIYDLTCEESTPDRTGIAAPHDDTRATMTKADDSSLKNETQSTNNTNQDYSGDGSLFVRGMNCAYNDASNREGSPSQEKSGEEYEDPDGIVVAASDDEDLFDDEGDLVI